LTASLKSKTVTCVSSS